MIDGLREWLGSVKDSLGDVYDNVKKVGGNFVEWCVDAPVIVSVLVGSTGLVLGWLYLVSYSSDPKPWVRGTGVLLQLIGFILAAYGLERALEKFGQTPSTSRILPWLNSFRDVFDTATVVNEEGSVSASVRFEVSEEVEYSLRPPQSVAQRLQNLEQEVKDLNNYLKAVRKEFSGEIEQLEGAIEEEQEARRQKIQEVEQTIEEANVGKDTLKLEWWGVSFFVYGVPLASFPSLFQPIWWVLAIPVVGGMLLRSLHWYAD